MNLQTKSRRERLWTVRPELARRSREYFTPTLRYLYKVGLSSARFFLTLLHRLVILNSNFRIHVGFLT